MKTVIRRVLGVAGFAAGLGVVSWLLKDRLVPVPDTGAGEPPPPFRVVPSPAPDGAAPPPPPPAPAEDPQTSAPPAPDDLTEINGVGPVFAQRLASGGITTFVALASADADEVAEMTQARPDQAEDWISQARQRS